MALENPDILEHGNKNLAAVDADFVKGGSRKTNTLATLITDFVSKTDQLKEGVTKVYVVSEGIDYRLIDIANVSSLSGWRAVRTFRPAPISVTDQETYTLAWDASKKQLYGDYGHFEVWQEASLQTVPIRFNVGEDNKPFEYIFTLDNINTLIFII